MLSTAARGTIISTYAIYKNKANSEAIVGDPCQTSLLLPPQLTGLTRSKYNIAPILYMIILEVLDVRHYLNALPLQYLHTHISYSASPHVNSRDNPGMSTSALEYGSP